MPSLKTLRIISGVTVLFILSFFIHSCKGDTEITSTNNPGNNPGETTLTISAPKNGDVMQVGSSFEIKWASNSTSKVKIEYSTDNGVSWIVIVTSTDNDGSYIWDPVANVSTIEGKIRMTTTDNLAINQSAGSFSIIRSTGKTLSLSKPNGGEVLNVGESFRIEWVSSNITSVKIDFSIDNGTNWNPVVSTFPADSGYYIWSPIPNSTSDNCLIRITDVASDTVSDVSNSVFKISSPQTIAVLSPNGGEGWEGNSIKNITWYSSQVANVKIEFTSDNGLNWSTIIASTPSDGFYTWTTIPNTPTNNARIRISDIIDLFPADASDSVFSISPELALNLTSPNGGENWMSGSGQYIKWNTAGQSPKPGGKGQISLFKHGPYVIETITNVKLEFTVNSGATWTTIAESVPNNGVFYWDSIPSLNSSLCLVRIKDAEDGVPFDVSDNTFTIYNNIQQEIIVISPNGGELWPAGSAQNIEWTSTGIATVNIDYTTNNGVNWIRIVSNIPSNGTFTWVQVPNSGSTNCKIKVSDVDNFPSDLSNGVFTIAPEPDIVILTPNGGENWQAGSTQNITWVSENIGSVKIEFTSNGGASWTSITSGTPSDGIYAWTIPNINSNLCKIKISDSTDGAPSDISDGPFIINNVTVQAISLTSPNGGESWLAGTTHNITWTASGVSSVKIEFTTDNGFNWTTVAASVPGSGSYAWSVPLVNSTQCKIRVSDASDGLPSDESDGAFIINPIQTLNVTYPNGGEVIIGGSSFNITWESTGIERVKIEWTYTNGLYDTSWHVLVNDVPSTGSYPGGFSIPASQYKVRISDADDGSPSDQSDGSFTVTPPPTITVTTPNGGENWLVGTTTEITWTSTYVSNVSIEYSLNGGGSWIVITPNVPSNGLYNWTIPSTIINRSDLCKIRISDAIDSIPVDQSDGYFSLHPQTKFLRWTFPNGGEFIYQDTLITWVSAGISQVNLEFTDNNGLTWNPIVNNLPSTGAYYWLMPPGPPSTLARIRITDSFDPLYTDMSDSYFYLHIRGGLEILTPGGTGDQNNAEYNSGDPVEISWKGIDKISDVRIDYSADNGRTWNQVARKLKNEFRKVNIFRWTNMPASVKGNIIFRISDNKGKYSKVSRPVLVR